MKVIKSEFLKMLKYRKAINLCPLEELDLSDFNFSDDSEISLEDWKVIGLDNIDYINHRLEERLSFLKF